MRKIIWPFISFSISLLPLMIIRAVGAYTILLVMFFSKRTKRRLIDNLTKTKVCPPHEINDLARESLKHLGMTLTESAYIAWRKDKKRILRLIEKVEGLDIVKEAVLAKTPIVFITPHIGNFEIAVKYFAYIMPEMDITIIYKPSPDQFLEGMIYNGRKEKNIHPVKATRNGAVALVKALKSNKTVGILPDNVASNGDGMWIKFFGVPVYATTLAAKLITSAIKPKAFIVSCTRTKTGFAIKAQEIIPVSLTSYQDVVRQIYSHIESLILDNPEQFYWSYNRFRTPNGVHYPNNINEL